MSYQQYSFNPDTSGGWNTGGKGVPNGANSGQGWFDVIGKVIDGVSNILEKPDITNVYTGGSAVNNTPPIPDTSDALVTPDNSSWFDKSMIGGIKNSTLLLIAGGGILLMSMKGGGRSRGGF